MNHYPQNRDPIMNDESFSLRFGNPIQVIHDYHPSSETRSPMHHVPYYAPSTLDKNNEDTSHRRHSQPDANTIQPPPSLVRTSSHDNFTRDVGSFADFVHSKEGRVDEIDHEK